MSKKRAVSKRGMVKRVAKKMGKAAMSHTKTMVKL